MATLTRTFITSTRGTESARVSPAWQVCAEYHSRALVAQRFWRGKAAIQLSDKGHVFQAGAFTGLAIDTFRGDFACFQRSWRPIHDRGGGGDARIGEDPAKVGRSCIWQGAASRRDGAIRCGGSSINLPADAQKRVRPLGSLEDIQHMRDELTREFDCDESLAVTARASQALDFTARRRAQRGSLSG